MQVEFTKMHGAGNDFIVVSDRLDQLDIDANSVRALCDRHFGIGADGVIRIGHSDIAQCFMDYRNADGSVAEMCGNGVRVVAKWLGDRGLLEHDLILETRGGSKRLTVLREGSEVARVSVNMGRATVQEEIVLDVPERTSVTLVNTGNPHAVVIVDDIDQVDIERVGPAIERHSLFPEGVNVPFIQLTADGFRQRTWERGCGETLACGTAATGAFAAMNAKSLVQAQAQIELRGGNLTMNFDEEGNVIMTGPAAEVFSGSFDGDTYGVKRI